MPVLSDNTRSSLFMVASMAMFSVEDTLIKAAARTTDLGFIVMMFGVGGSLLFMLLCSRKKERIFHPSMLSRSILIRASCEVTGRLTYALAITLTALSSASAILQATPLIAMTGAALLFGEHIGFRRWLAVLIGFVGVMLIIQPGLDGFEAESIFAVIATIGFAGRDLATRAAPPVLSNNQLGICGFLVLIPTGLVMMQFNPAPLVVDSVSGLQIAGAVLIGVTAYNALTIAMRSGDVSVVSPFRYTRLLFALMIGVAVFGESPDLATIAGSTLVVVSGCYTLLHSKKTKAPVPVTGTQ